MLFALVRTAPAIRGSKLAATRWVEQFAPVPGLPNVNEDAAYRAMDLMPPAPTARTTSLTPRSPATNAVVRDDSSHDDSHSSDVDNDAATATGTRGWVPHL